MDRAEFDALHMPALEQNEVRHNLLLGLMSQVSPSPAAHEMRRWTLGGAGACAIQRSANRGVILGDLEQGEEPLRDLEATLPRMGSRESRHGSSRPWLRENVAGWF
jgi:hypothetical protein